MYKVFFDENTENAFLPQRFTPLSQIAILKKNGLSQIAILKKMVLWTVAFRHDIYLSTRHMWLTRENFSTHNALSSIKCSVLCVAILHHSISS
jgi:hypothetical protein